MDNQAYNKISRIFDDENQPENKAESLNPASPTKEKDSWESEFEGQLAVDIFQTENAVKIVAPIAGVKPDNLDISITGNNLTIKGTRQTESEIKKEHYLIQECYWGSFSRSIELSKGINTEKAAANLKNGVLIITLPKEPETQTKVLKIETD